MKPIVGNGHFAGARERLLTGRTDPVASKFQFRRTLFSKQPPEWSKIAIPTDFPSSCLSNGSTNDFPTDFICSNQHLFRAIKVVNTCQKPSAVIAYLV